MVGKSSLEQAQTKDVCEGAWVSFIIDLAPARDQVYKPHCPTLSADAAMYVFSVTGGQSSAHV